MNTPAGKPPYPIDPFADVSHAARERAVPEQQQSGADNGPLRSPYAPKKVHERARAQHLVDPDPTAPPQPAHPNSRPYERPAGARRDEIMSELERLEAGLRPVRREQTTARLPLLPPVPGLPAVGEMFGHGFRSPRSLEPERLVSPAAMMSRRDRLRWPLWILITGIFAAPIAYYFSVRGWAPPSTHGPQMASVDPMTVAPSISKKERQPIKARDDDSGSLAEDRISSQRTRTSRTAPLSEGGTLAMLPPGETDVQASLSNKTVRVLGSEEIKLLTRQGAQFAEAGDLVTARVLLQRAAEADDATAATALGATYDPTVIAKLGVVGIGADVEKARFWYRKAASLGSTDAKRRLDLLANR
jgi:hypothetical protein